MAMTMIAMIAMVDISHRYPARWRENAGPPVAAYSGRITENARAMADELMNRGLPIISGGTDTHLMLVDVGSRGLSGSKAEKLLDRVGITCNKNTIPGDTRSPAQASGIRLGTPAVTTRGFGPEECRLVAGYIVDVLEAPEDDRIHARVSDDVREMMERFPLPGVN